VTDGPIRDPRSSLPAAIVAAASELDADRVLQAILDIAVDALGPVNAATYLQDPDRPTLQLAASHGLAATSLGDAGAAPTDPLDPFVQAATQRTAIFDRETEGSDGSRVVGSYLPMVVSSSGTEVVLGTLGMTWPAPHVSDDATREALEAVAALSALAADRSRLASTAAERSEWFERMAHSDPLTGLANERTVSRILELELARAGRQGGEVSLALFDVDDFRATNAGGGHAAGDDVLRRVAAVLAESVRLVDTVGRIGGDEFVLVAPGSAGATVARRVLDGIAALPAVDGRPVSVSAGVARFPSDGSDAGSLIAAATTALDRARSEGRGSVAETAGVAEG
jgi:diguanylate cyclase (GGDEF)-like protein